MILGGKPTTITSGSDWFVNWADFPANATNGDVLLTSHLQKISLRKHIPMMSFLISEN